MDPAGLVDAEVARARLERGELAIGTARGTLRYARVRALGVTAGARIAAAQWVEDTLPQTLLSEIERGLARAEAPRGLVWLLGGAADFERASVRDALAFTGGRWFRVFVGADAASVDE